MMPDINKPAYDPTAKQNQWPKAFYHPTEPMRTVGEEAAAELRKEDPRWRNQPYHNPDGSPIKGDPRKTSGNDQKDAGGQKTEGGEKSDGQAQDPDADDGQKTKGNKNK